MTRLNLAILALLVPTALAIPKYGNKGPGFSTGVTIGPLSTGASEAPYAQHNSTVVAPIGTGAAPNRLTTVTVVPVPASSGANEAPVSSSASVIDHHAGGSNTEAPITGSAPAGECGKATVTVTSANTVTVTVGVVPVGSSGAASESPVTYPVASPEASSSSAQSENGPHKFPTGAETATGTVPLGSSTGVAPASPIPTGAHGHHHASLHRSKTSSLAVASSSHDVPAPSNTPVPESSTSEIPVASESSSTPVPESSTSEIPVAPESSSPPAPEKSTSETPVAPESSSPPAPEKSTSETPVAPESSSPPAPESSTSKAPVVTPVAESTASVTPLAPYTPPVPRSTPSPTSTSEAATSPSSAPIPKSYGSTPDTKSHVSTSGGDITPRGLVYNTATLTDLFSSSNAISWAYNWDSQPGGSLSPNFNFVPQLWGPIPVHTDHWKENADKALASGSTHILGFNEPDLPAQANLSPDEAVKAWTTYLEPYAGKAKLGSPAVCNGNDANMGLNWLSSFLSACGNRCTVDFVAIHWYGLATDAGVADLKDHVAKTKAACGGREVWLTEFAPSGSADEQADFMSQILPWLDDTSKSGVARYAYYQVDGILASGDSLTKLGNVYAA